MSRAPLAYLFVIAALAGCATVSGLADKETVDCPGGCADVGLPPTPTSTSGDDAGPPDPIDDGGVLPPDASLDFTKPDGWKLVAVASSGNDTPPACPSGFDIPSDVGTNPGPSPSTCECATCTVTQQAVCTGAPMVSVSPANTCNTVAAGSYGNDPAGQCNNDLTAGLDRTGFHVKVKLAPVSGGACTADAPIAHPDRVQMGNRRRVCDETARCNGNLCDATVPAPFAACVASTKGSGDQQCPPGFPTKLVLARANVACNPNNCDCNVAKTDCTGALTYYKDANCTAGAVSVPADDTCRATTLSGTYLAYKVTATTTTSCTVKGSSAATVTSADVRTVCCP